MELTSGRTEGYTLAARHEVRLDWKDVSYSIQPRKQPRRILLNNVHGSAQQGDVVAVMGPSGAGKTTLLNALAGRLEYIKDAELHGHILVNGHDMDRSTFRRISAYVMQTDALYGHLTVRETILMAAILRLPADVPTEQKHAQVEKLISELGLSKVADSIVGDEMQRGLSGGEKKRTTIAVELIANPSLLFLDEPTTGLDSFQAYNVMEALQRLASGGRTILTTIHQPRSSIFNMFDKIILLSEGEVVYAGLAKRAVSYFTERGHPCPQHYNPADFFLDLIALDYRSPELEKSSRGRREELVSYWNGQHAPSAHEVLSSELNEGSQHAVATKNTSWLQQFYHLSVRVLRQTTRNKFMTYVMVGQHILIGVVLGALYSDISTDADSVHDRMGVLMFLIINEAFNALFAAVNTFPPERVVMRRERAAKSYHASAFYLAKVIAEAPFHLIGPIVFMLPCYFLAHLRNSASAFLSNLFSVCLLYYSGNALGMVISALSPTVQIAGAAGPPVLVILLIFGGFYINVDSLPVGAQWIKYLSCIYWAFRSLTIIEFRDNEYPCTDGTDNSGIDGTASPVTYDPDCPFEGERALEDLNFEDYNVFMSNVYQIVLAIGLHLVAYFIVTRDVPKWQPLLHPTEESLSKKPVYETPPAPGTSAASFASASGGSTGADGPMPLATVDGGDGGGDGSGCSASGFGGEADSDTGTDRRSLDRSGGESDGSSDIGSNTDTDSDR
eukprot:Rmarinus@m.24838